MKKPTRKKIKTKPTGKYHHGDLKVALMEAAVSLMKTTGSLEFSLRDITSRAGVTHTSIYRHFPSKVYLLAALAEEGFTRFKAALDRATLRFEGDPVRQLSEQAVAYVTFALENPVYYKLMFSEKIAECMELPSLARATQDAFMSLMNLVIEGVKQGVLRKGDPREIALTIWSGTHGLAMLMLNGLLENAFELGAKQAAHAAKLVSYFVQNGVLAQGGQSK